MKKSIFITIILLYSIVSFSQENSNRLLTFGSENYHHTKATKFVANEWNIEVYKVAGISVEARIVDSVRIKNSELWKKFDGIKKTDSKKQFQKQVISEMKDIYAAQKLFDSDRKAKKLKRKIRKSNITAYGELASKTGKGKYVWIIYSQKLLSHFSAIAKAEYEAIVDINNGQVELNVAKKTNANNAYN